MFTGLLDNIWTQDVWYILSVALQYHHIFDQNILSTKLYRITHSIWSDHLGDADRFKSRPYLRLWRCWSQDLIQTTWRHLWVQIWVEPEDKRPGWVIHIVSTGQKSKIKWKITHAFICILFLFIFFNSFTQSLKFYTAVIHHSFIWSWFF